MFGRYGWALRSELEGPVEPIDTSIMLLLHRVMTEASRARSSGDNLQALRLATRATNLLKACLRPILTFAAEEASGPEPNVPLSIKQFVAEQTPTAQGHWQSGQREWRRYRSPESRAPAPTAVGTHSPQRAAGGAPAGMPVRMLLAAHRHQRKQLQPLLPPTGPEHAAGPTAPATAAAQAAPMQSCLPRVMGHSPYQRAGTAPHMPLHPHPPAQPSLGQPTIRVGSPAPPSPRLLLGSSLRRKSLPVDLGRFAAFGSAGLTAASPKSNPWLQNGKSQVVVLRHELGASVPASIGEDEAPAAGAAPSVSPRLEATPLRSTGRLSNSTDKAAHSSGFSFASMLAQSRQGHGIDVRHSWSPSTPLRRRHSLMQAGRAFSPPGMRNLPSPSKSRVPTGPALGQGQTSRALSLPAAPTDGLSKSMGRPRQGASSSSESPFKYMAGGAQPHLFLCGPAASASQH